MDKLTVSKTGSTQIIHDGKFDIALGKHRKEKNWKNREWLWSDLVKKLSVTHRTAEKYAEYIAAKKDRQDEIKDIGGFVGGRLVSGRRKKGNVLHKQLITLDIDFAEVSTWDDFTMIYDCAAAMYSTHKHSPDHPRLRIIIPLDRPVTAEEYPAIARKVAGNMGIESFDHTTFQPERLMYWPSTARDGEFVFKYQDGVWLSADEVLESYNDWQDVSEWPVSDRENSVVARGIKKQGDPLEKPGIIGAFCRTYGISEAIEKFLPDVYDSCDMEGRFTFKEGSTAGGLVVYDDKYAFSHHGTDPVSGKLCNAFDLVRLHKFGLQDEDARDDIPGNKLPSYVDMIEFCTKDPAVRKQVGSERLSDAKADFDDGEVTEEQEGDDDWLSALDVDKRGNYKSTIHNVSLILENDPRLKGCFATDLFRKKKMVMRNLPWRKLDNDTPYLKDQDEQNFTKYLEKTYNIMNRSNLKDAFDTHIDAHGFHPVRDYLNSLKWDGEKRVDRLFIDYLGALDSDYMRAVTRKTIVAAVARIFQPGVKFETMLTLIGKQGIGKSTLLRKLGKEWFNDSFNFNMLHKKDAIEQIQGFWIIEVSELNGMKKAEVDAAKSFLSIEEDSFRPAYGRNVVTVKRQCILLGTTNNRDFLRDPTGNRRFWPVDVMNGKPAKSVFRDLNDAEVDQIWAEAVRIYSNKESLFLDSKLEKEAIKHQKQHTEQDARLGMVERYLETLLPENWEEMDTYARRAYLNEEDELKPVGKIQRDRVCAVEIWVEVLQGSQKDFDKLKVREVHDIMRQIGGWEETETKIRFGKYGVQRGYLRQHSRQHSRQHFPN